jgi:hypothetical protein
MASFQKYLKKLLVFTGLILCCMSFGYAQQQRSDFWQNVRFGGGIGLGFGNEYFSIALSPGAVYQVSDKFATGLGLNFNYSKIDQSEFTAYGFSWLNFFNPIPPIQLSAELQPLRVSTNYPNSFPDLDENYWTTALFLGIGYSTPNVTFGVQYDVLYDSTRSIYSNPWIPFVRVFF